MIQLAKVSMAIALLAISCVSKDVSKQGRENNNSEKSKSSALMSNMVSSKEIELGKILRMSLENYHFVKLKIDDDLSEKAYKIFLEKVDYGKQFLLQEDVKKFEEYKYKFDDELITGQLKVADLAEEVLKKRILNAKTFVDRALAKEFNWNENQKYQTDPEKRKYAGNLKELEARWGNIIKLDIMNQYLELKDEQEGIGEDGEKKKKEIVKKEKKLSKDELFVKAKTKIKKRYNKVFKRLLDRKKFDKLDRFYNSITRIFDPHTHYFVPEEKEDFDIEMSGKLEGIGAVLREDGSYIKVERIVPGSPSWKGKELQKEDLILAVGQDDDDPVDVVDMALRDAVKMIRGKKGTTVKLTVKKPDGSTKIIPIVRDEIVMEATYVKGSVLEDKKHGKKIGYVKVPKFYRDFENDNGRNSSTDVKNELIKLNKEKVDAVILDLRNNGGGALIDATLMGGLFIDSGPIVQVKSSHRPKAVNEDEDGKTYFSGPLVVLVNNNSASASEIVAAALQDYGRAVIVGSGDQTHGKGTVQAVIGLDERAGPMARIFSPFGAMKITIQMFYRITGESTQFRGVVPDIALPDPYEGFSDEIGEKSLDYAIPYQKIAAVKYKKLTPNYNLSSLKSNSEKRVEQNPKFKKIRESVTWYKKRRENSELVLSLDYLENYRKEAREKSKEFKNEEENKQIIVKTMEKARDEVEKEQFAEFKKSMRTDPVIEETLNIIHEMIK